MVPEYDGPTPPDTPPGQYPRWLPGAVLAAFVIIMIWNC